MKPTLRLRLLLQCCYVDELLPYALHFYSHHTFRIGDHIYNNRFIDHLALQQNRTNETVVVVKTTTRRSTHFLGLFGPAKWGTDSFSHIPIC
jgi:hypothetical protein